MLQRLLPSLLILVMLGALLAAMSAAQGELGVDPDRAQPPGVLDEATRERAASKIDESLLPLLDDPAAAPLTVIVHTGRQADLSLALSAQSRAERTAYVYQALQEHARVSQASLRGYLDAGLAGGWIAEYRGFFIIDGLAVTAAPGAIWQIALRDDVERVAPNHVYHLNSEVQLLGEVELLSQTPEVRLFPKVELLSFSPGVAEWNVAHIRADQVWTTYGITGQGVVVASLDSGVHYRHPALMGQYAGNLGNGVFDHDYHWFDATASQASAPFDDNGHGTHTLGIAVGGDGPGPMLNDIGVAPGAAWIAVKVFTAAGSGDSASILAGFEWLLAPCRIGVQPGDAACDPARAPHVVNSSWGHTSSTRSEFVPAVQALRAAGILPVFSAGNSGPQTGSLNSPASFDVAFAVGATDSNDLIASFSSRGPSPVTAAVKPDVTAPGVGVRSAVPPNNYTAFNGTSMAAPHVSGLAALMLSARPDLDLASLEDLMRATAFDLGASGPDSVYGHGRIDALAALQRLVDAGALAGVARDAADGAALAGVEVRAQGNGLDVTTTTAADGSYYLDFLVTGAYTLTASVYGYEVLTLADVQAPGGAVTEQDLELVSLPRHTLSGRVFGAGGAPRALAPVINARVTALNTPLAPVFTDDDGAFALTVAPGAVTLEVAAFGFATALETRQIDADAVIDFVLSPLPPVLLVDDDEGRNRTISPNVEEYYFNALDSNGYSYDYWDIELDGSPGFDAIRQYAAVVWFGGEFGRIKDISDADQAQALMDYLDLGGRLLYVAQSHTFYFGPDKPCDTPTWGGTGPCPFTADYLGVADWIEDMRASVNHGVAGDPVGEGFGALTMTYPPLFTDFSDHITGTVSASLAFTATVDGRPGRVNHTVYTLEGPAPAAAQGGVNVEGFKTVFMATALEAMSPADAADVMFAVMEWFGVAGLSDGVTLAPSRLTRAALPGESILFPLRLRNLGHQPDTFDLTLLQAPWPASTWDASLSEAIDQLGPVPAGDTADFNLVVEAPAGAAPGSQVQVRLAAVSQSGTPYAAEAHLTAQARMSYYTRDSSQCATDVAFDWVDATGGEHWRVGRYQGAVLPDFRSVSLPQPFLFYNHAYDRLYFNDFATILFGEGNLYDDRIPSGSPPIPNPTVSDPNNAIYIAWGNSYWHPPSQAEEAGVYTYHDTAAGRNRFVVQYHRYPNLLGAEDTFQAILDLETYDITLQYDTITRHTGAVVGIENAEGTDGVLYVNRQVPPENILHDGLAVRFGVGEAPPLLQVEVASDAGEKSGDPGQVVSYTLTISSTSSISDTYSLEVGGALWPTTLWDAGFNAPIAEIGPLPPCSTRSLGVRVEVPDLDAHLFDTATIRVRSQRDPLVAASAELTTLTSSTASQRLLLPLILR